MNKKRVVIICPGRGSYTRETSGYLENSSSYLTEYLSDFDKKRLEMASSLSEKCSKFLVTMARRYQIVLLFLAH